MLRYIYIVSFIMLLNSCGLIQQQIPSQENVTQLCEDAYTVITFFKMREVLKHLNKYDEQRPGACLVATTIHQKEYDSVQNTILKCPTITTNELLDNLELEKTRKTRSIYGIRSIIHDKWFAEMEIKKREDSDQLLQSFLDLRPLKGNFARFCEYTDSVIKQTREIDKN